MTLLASVSLAQEAPGPVTSRAGLARFMRRICAEMGAERYMLVEPSVERGPKSVRILTSNWVFDALEDLGSEGIAKIIESDYATGAGTAHRAMTPAATCFLTTEEKRALREHDHAELYCLKLCVNGAAIFALLSASAPQRIDRTGLLRAHMAMRYALSQLFAACGDRSSRDPLSEREREGLLWVSEGKTTDEVALILGVSSNTVNSYVAHAIQKFGANNRAMAIATAIRSGII